MTNQLSSRHKQVARLLVGGHTQTEIARILNVHNYTISRILRQQGIAEEVSRFNEMADVKPTACVPGIPEKIREGAQRGVAVLQQILEDKRSDPEIMRLKMNVALELLTRAGCGAIKQVQVQQATVSAVLSAEDIEEIKRQAMETLEQGCARGDS